MPDQSFIKKQLQRKQKQKKAFDIKTSRAIHQKGLIIIHTGQGKGKSTAAFGMLTRALSHQMKSVVIQFVKGQMKSAERDFFSQMKGLEFYTANDGFTWLNDDLDQELNHAQALWEMAKKKLVDPNVQLIILDELNIMLHYEYLDQNEVIEVLSKRPKMQHVVLTGRHASKDLINAADLVSNIQMVKHPFHDQRIQAQKGIEF